MYRLLNSRGFKINEFFSVACRSEKTSYGFRHTATLVNSHGRTLGYYKASYYNRTWEAYEFQSVIQGALKNAFEEGCLSKEEFMEMDLWSKKGQEDLSHLKNVAFVAAMGDLFGKTPKEKNDWKARMLKAGLEGRGLIMPDDWDELDEATKQTRLDGAIKMLGEKNED